MTEVRILTSHLGWIVEAFARESASAVGEKIRLTQVPVRRREYIRPKNWQIKKLPRMSEDKILFLHHETLLRNKDSLLNRDVRLLLTHFDSKETLDTKLLHKLSSVSRIVVQNKEIFNLLTNNGVERSNIRIAYGAVNRSEYFPLKENIFENFILIVGSCKPRKNPGLVAKIILENPDKRFVIHGIDWNNHLSTKTLASPNLRLIEFSRKGNPHLMRNASLLLSLSLNEGGPIPVLEALASGTPVLASDTGFCKEVIPAEYGVVVSQSAQPEEISPLIDGLLLKKSRCWSQDLLKGKFTWRELGELLYGD